MKSIKRILIIDAILLCLSVLIFTATTIAYFTSQKKVTATFTSGDVKISLSQAAVKKDATGHLVEDLTQPRIFGSEDGTPYDYGIIFPGQTIYKDPTIKNIGYNDAYIAAKVTISDGAGDLHKLIGYENDDHIDIEMLLGGGLFDEDGLHFGQWNGLEGVTYNDRFAMIQIPDVQNGRYHLYFFILPIMSHNEEIELFDTMYVNPDWSGEDMKELRDLKIEVAAYGVQTFGFSSCYEAVTAAFSDHFSDVAPLD